MMPMWLWITQLQLSINSPWLRLFHRLLTGHLSPCRWQGGGLCHETTYVVYLSLFLLLVMLKYGLLACCTLRKLALVRHQSEREGDAPRDACTALGTQPRVGCVA